MSVDLDLAYLAGLIDGEGTITLDRTANPRAFRAPMLSISSTDRELVDAAVQILGVGAVQVKSRSRAPDHHKTGYEYRVKRNAALYALGLVRPYIRHPEKLRRANLLLAEYAQLTRRNGRYTPEERAARLDLEHRVLKS